MMQEQRPQGRGCCANCAIWFIGLVNLIVLAAGIVIGVVYGPKYYNSDWKSLISTDRILIWLIVVCCIVVVSSLIGFGVICCPQAKCLLFIYWVFVTLVIGVEIAAVVICYKYTSMVMEMIQENWNSSETAIRTARRLVENELACCGFSNVSDTNYTDCGYNYTAANLTTANTSLCYSALYAKVESNMKWVGGGCIILLGIEFLLWIFAFYLTCCWHPEERVQDITRP